MSGAIRHLSSPFIGAVLARRSRPIAGSSVVTNCSTSSCCYPYSTSTPNSSTPPTTTATAPPQMKKVSVPSLVSKKRHGRKISMITAYDYPSALHVTRAAIDILLVGDSCAMVELGYDTTQPMTLDQMIHHCEAVKRGAPNGPLLVGDMPLGTYEYDDTDVALRNAYRLVKEGGMDAVKLEGGSDLRARTVQKVVEGGVAVMGHVGLTPQAISVIGEFGFSIDLLGLVSSYISCVSFAIPLHIWMTIGSTPNLFWCRWQCSIRNPLTATSFILSLSLYPPLSSH